MSIRLQGKPLASDLRGAIRNPGSMARYSEEVLADYPLGYWKLDEVSGSVATDSSPNGNNGTYVNGVALGISGKVEASKCASFDGVDDYVLAPLAPKLDSWTLEGWFLPYAIGYRTLFSRRMAQGVELGLIAGTTKLRVTANATPSNIDYNTGAAPDIGGNWHYICITYSPDLLSIYIDGLIRATLDTTGKVYNDDSAIDVVIGARFGGTGAWSQQLAQHCAIYDYALSAERIKAHYNASIG